MCVMMVLSIVRSWTISVKFCKTISLEELNFLKNDLFVFSYIYDEMH